MVPRLAPYSACLRIVVLTTVESSNQTRHEGNGYRKEGTGNMSHIISARQQATIPFVWSVAPAAEENAERIASRKREPPQTILSVRVFPLTRTAKSGFYEGKLMPGSVCLGQQRQQGALLLVRKWKKGTRPTPVEASLDHLEAIQRKRDTFQASPCNTDCGGIFLSPQFLNCSYRASLLSGSLFVRTCACSVRCSV